MKYRLSELAELVGGKVQGDPDRLIEGLRSLDKAGPRDLSFVTNKRYRSQVAASGAGALLVDTPFAGIDKDYLLADEPYYALAQIVAEVYPHRSLPIGVHPTAIVEAGARVDPDAAVGPYVVIGRDSQIGPEVELHTHVVIGDSCIIGRGSLLYPHAVVYPGSILGEHCILQAGVVLGSDGFGYALHEGTHVKLEHGGRVVLEDHVEIGSNSTVDRALLDETRIGAGSKIDNLVQVAHNVRLGKACLLISQSGIAGSSRLGDGVVVAGQSGVSGHLELGDGVVVAAKSAVFKSIEDGRTVAGIPAVDAGAWKRQQVLIARLAELRKRVARLEVEQGSRKKGDERE